MWCLDNQIKKEKKKQFGSQGQKIVWRTSVTWNWLISETFEGKCNTSKQQEKFEISYLICLVDTQEYKSESKVSQYFGNMRHSNTSGCFYQGHEGDKPHSIVRCWACLILSECYSSDLPLWLRTTSPYFIIKVLEPSGYCSEINCTFTFCATNIFGCFHVWTCSRRYFGLARNLIRRIITPNQDDLSYSSRTFFSGSRNWVNCQTQSLWLNNVV